MITYKNKTIKILPATQMPFIQKQHQNDAYIPFLECGDDFDLIDRVVDFIDSISKHFSDIDPWYDTVYCFYRDNNWAIVMFDFNQMNKEVCVDKA